MDRPLDPAFRRRRRIRQIGPFPGRTGRARLPLRLAARLDPAVGGLRPHPHRAGAAGSRGGDDHRFRHRGSPVRADPLQSSQHPSRADSAQTGGPAAAGRGDRRARPERGADRGRETGGRAGAQAEPAHPDRAGGAQKPQRPGDEPAPEEIGPGAPADPHRPVPRAAENRRGFRGAAAPGPARGGARRHRAAAARREPPQP